MEDDEVRGERPGSLWADGSAPAEDAEPHEAAPTKICPACSVAEQTTGAYCSHCGAAYERRPSRRGSRRVRVIGLACVLALVGGGSATALAIKHQNDQDAKHRRALVAKHREQVAQRQARERADAARRAREARQAREAQQQKDDLTRSLRRSLVADLRKSITKDARGRVADGYLDGPIYGTQCDPIGGGNLSDLDSKTGRYSCLAYNKKNADGTIEGYSFTATVNYEKFSYQWHLGNT